MQHEALITQLRALKLTGMAEAFEQQLEQPATHDDLSFSERLALLTDRESCVFASKLVTDSHASWSPVLIEVGQRFRPEVGH